MRRISMCAPFLLLLAVGPGATAPLSSCIEEVNSLSSLQNPSQQHIRELCEHIEWIDRLLDEIYEARKRWQTSSLEGRMKIRNHNEWRRRQIQRLDERIKFLGVVLFGEGPSI